MKSLWRGFRVFKNNRSRLIQNLGRMAFYPEREHFMLKFVVLLMYNGCKGIDKRKISVKLISQLNVVLLMKCTNWKILTAFLSCSILAIKVEIEFW